MRWLMANGGTDIKMLGWRVSTITLAIVSALVLPISMRTWARAEEVADNVTALDKSMAVIEGNRYTSSNHMAYALEMSKEMASIWTEIRSIKADVATIYATPWAQAVRDNQAAMLLRLDRIEEALKGMEQR